MTDQQVFDPNTSVFKEKDKALRLFGLSFLMLFLELALIRWLGANVLYLGYFSNLILLGSFLGIGLAFLSAKRGPRWIHALPLTLLALVGLVLAFPIEVSRTSSNVIFFGGPEPRGLPVWIVVPVIFALVVAVMAMVAHEVALAFAELRPLSAYAWDISGSLVGIVSFTALSYLRAPPLAWGIAVVISLMFFVRSWQGRDYLALAGIAFLLGVQTFVPGLSWSPYYQVMTSEVDGRSHISVNGIPHQIVYSVSYLSATLYNLPYEFVIDSAPDRVLVVGAGSGNDVALALAHGAGYVDAVEIDPTIQQLGEHLHPDRPYADPRVTVVIDDGRAFMQRSRGNYDLVIFALPDSLTLLSGQSSLRLESYLFTVEAIEQARTLLAPNGAFVMYNFYREDWLIARLSATMAQAFGEEPCVVSVGEIDRLALLAVGANSASACPGAIGSNVAGPPPSTDDYPFLYVRDRGIPGLYTVTLTLIALGSLATVRVGVGSFSRLKPYGDLFALGVAFLLLETKSVVQFALWFGTTWVVNALVFAGILAAVLGAVIVTKKVSLPRATILYGMLFVSLAIAWTIPPAALLDLAVPLRWAMATILTFTPVFLANLIFAQRFAQTASATAAFGANLLGALFGGILEYAALIVGYRALILLAGIAYLAALMWRPRRSASPAN
jgi:Spermine/spermidine synthase domain